VLTIENGTGSGQRPGNPTARYGECPTGRSAICAMASDYQVLLAPTAQTITPTVPYQNVTIRATYADLATYALIVVHGFGRGPIRAGRGCQLRPTPRRRGSTLEFERPHVSLLEDPTSATTTLTMPDREAAVVIDCVVYTLSVDGGSGDGTSQKGQ
jgi:hypothetical protein